MYFESIDDVLLFIASLCLNIRFMHFDLKNVNTAVYKAEATKSLASLVF